MTKRSWLVRALFAATLLLPGSTFAQGAAQGDVIKQVHLLVPDARGQASWGTKHVTRALVRVLKEEVGEVREEADLSSAAMMAGIPPNKIWAVPSLARAGKELGAHWVLRVTLKKRGWLYTAHAVLVNASNGAIDMDFRSDYYKPDSEAKDRGFRVARKTVEKIKTLLAIKGLPAVGKTAVAEVTPPPADKIPPDVQPDTVPPDVQPDKLPPDVQPDTTPPDTSTTEATPTETGTAGAVAMATEGDVGDTSFEDEFAAEFGDAGAATTGTETEFDGFTDEGGWQWNVRGWVGTKYWAFFSNDIAEGKKRHIVKTGFRSTITGKLGKDARLRVLPLVEVDLVNQRLHRVIVEEGFLEYSGLWPLEFRIGWDSLTWGSASTVHVVDVINARDFTEGVSDAPKVGQPMFSAKYIFGNHSLSLLYMTPFIPPQLPHVDSPFSTFDAPPGADPKTFRWGESVVYASDLDEWHPQLAARLALAMHRVDIRGSYFYGYSRFPFVHLPTESLFFPLLHHASTDFQVLFGQTTVKAEVAYVVHQNTERTENPPITLRNGQPAASILLPGPRVTWVAGVEHTFDDFLWGSTFIPVAEFIGDSDSGWFTDDQPPDDLSRFFENHLAYGFKWDFNNDVDSQLLFSDIVDLRHLGDHLFMLEYKERWFQHFTFVLGARLGTAEDGNKGVGFRQLTGVYSEFRLNY